MEKRKNVGYIITNEMTVGGTEIVLGVHENNSDRCVTWQCREGCDYFYGHYFMNLLDAQEDFCERILDRIENLK